MEKNVCSGDCSPRGKDNILEAKLMADSKCLAYRATSLESIYNVFLRLTCMQMDKGLHDVDFNN